MLRYDLKSVPKSVQESQSWQDPVRQTQSTPEVFPRSAPQADSYTKSPSYRHWVRYDQPQAMLAPSAPAAPAGPYVKPTSTSLAARPSFALGDIQQGMVNFSIPFSPQLELENVEILPGTTADVTVGVSKGSIDPAASSIKFSPPLKGPWGVSIPKLKITENYQLQATIGWFDTDVTQRVLGVGRVPHQLDQLITRLDANMPLQGAQATVNGSFAPNKFVKNAVFDLPGNSRLSIQTVSHTPQQ